ncbi:MAG: hypothetical protein HOF74_01185 [Gammaproteobacteria bacterium]|jgi:hypothetical protein|nr:hypothetical protein [Gammaproteobacteria bacterium]MBT3858420.1 hypothetical protein [Gammaproteobacteria bacterium]MBT3986842.1 hypothetical protein [Gammaproteobacteria bacterium]MBT4256267.1 hypothetical protein [Gammaproteobacteria bacterium]MBT4581222.1 hypothetical protein [Gammaproteobacteria bacterium]
MIVLPKGLLQEFELAADRETMAPLPKEMNAHSRLVESATVESFPLSG